MDKILDKDNFSKRLNRYFQITSQVGGIVTRIGANKYLGLNTDQKKMLIIYKRNLDKQKVLL